MSNPFDCAHCQHPIHRHIVTKWPQISKLCPDCNCPGFFPNYKYVCTTCGGKRVMQAAQVFRHVSGPFVNWRDTQTIPCPKCNQENN